MYVYTTMVFKCGVCGNISYTKYDFNIHNQKHDDSLRIRQYKCDRCDYKAYNSATLNSHIASHIRKLTKHECPNCDKFAETKKDLRYHLRYGCIRTKPLILDT